MPIKNVCIGIQARSGSHRLPRKVFEPIGGKPMLSHVIHAADKSAYYLNRDTFRSGIDVKYFVLCPYQDEIVKAFSSRATVIQGPEDDVLSRYMIMVGKLDPDYIVRITGDCPLVPYWLITKLIKAAIKCEYDYCSNVDPSYRTAMDGYDVEVVSRAAIEWADKNVSDPKHREHVTSILRTDEAPKEFRRGIFLNHFDHSHLKLSVDTVEDLERVRIEYERKQSKYEAAVRTFGKRDVHLV